MKRIKLKNLLKYIDPICSVVIWYLNEDEDPGRGEPTFEGISMDTPYWLTELYIADPKHNDGDGTIDSRLADAQHSKSIMIICVED